MLAAINLTFAHPQSRPLLTNWSEQFARGTVTAITGPSGRGKSSLLYILGLMLAPQGGEVALDGQVISTLSDSQRSHIRAEKFGFVFQDAMLDPSRTVIDNVIEVALYSRIPRRLALSRAQELLVQLGVSGRTAARPGAISGGQAQRIALARALLNEPQVILADEPTGNLDEENSKRVSAVLRDRANAGAIVIVVTHDPRVTSWSDREVQL